MARKMPVPQRDRIPWIAALVVASFLVPFLARASDQAREVLLEQEITTDPGDELPPLHIDDGSIRAEVEKLLDVEGKLASIEASLAADLSGRGGTFTPESREAVTKTLCELYKSLAEDKAVPEGLSKELKTLTESEDSVPSTMYLYWLCSSVSRALDETVSKRHALENRYFSKLLGGKPSDETEGAEPAKTFFDSASQDQIIVLLRERMDAVRLLRQEKIDSFLLARRAVDRTSLPTATFERANDLWFSDTAELERLEEELEAARSYQRDLLANKESREALVRHAEKLIEECGDTPEEKAHKERLQGKLKHLKDQVAKAQESVEAQKTKIGDLTKAIEQEKLGYDTQKGGVRQETWLREAIDQLGATISSGYAELAVRRRIMKRVTREAVHNYQLAEKLSAFRRMYHTGEQREAILTGADKYSGKALRGAYIDQGLASIAQRERRDEDCFMGQLDYALRIMSALKKLGVDGVRKRLDHIGLLYDQIQNLRAGDYDAFKAKWADLSKELRFFIDDVEHLKEIGGGAFTVFIEQAKSLLVVTNLYEARLEVEKTHEKVRDKRKDTRAQINLLVEALGKDDSDIRALFGLSTGERRPWTFETFRTKKFTKRELELFHKDKAFYDALDGGLRRIAASMYTARLDLAVTEYLIAYEKACFTLRELDQTKNDIHGLDPETGEFSFKLFLSPVRVLLAAGRFAYRWLDPVYGPHETEIEQWVNKRAEQLEGMRLTYDQLKKAEFHWPKVEKAAEKTKHSWHEELLREHPQYRRFWHKLEQENHSEKQATLTVSYESRKDWFPKQVAREKLELLDESMPSPQMLAFAHLQDSLDHIQLYNYPAALNSLILANELDSTLVPTKHIEETENLIWWWETGAKWGRLVQEIVDQCVWYLISQGVMNRVIGPLRQSLAAALKVPLPPPPTQSLAQQFGNVLKGYFNPLRNVISYETFAQHGYKAALWRFTRETVYELAEDSFKEEVMLRSWKMDPAVADRLAGMMFNLFTEALEATTEVGADAAGVKIQKIKDSDTYRRIKNSSLYYYCAYLKSRVGALRPRSANAEVESKESVEDWEARRAVNRRAELEKVEAALKELDEQGTKKTGEDDPQKPAEGEDKPADEQKPKLTDEEIEVRRKLLNAQKRILTEPIDSENILAILKDLPFDLDNAKKMLDETLPDDVRDKTVSDAIELIRIIESSVKDIDGVLKAKKDTEGLKKILEVLDTARHVIHRQSFNRIARLLQDGSDADIKAFLKEAGAPDISPARMREILKMILAVVPTGSAGYLSRTEGGEYKPYESDMDFTVLIRQLEGIDPAKPEERVALEKLLGHGLKDVAKGLDTEAFDIAYMVDDVSKFTGASLDRRGPQEVMDEIQKVKDTEFENEADRQKALEDLHKQLKSALETTIADLAHPERYRTPGRLRMLWYLTALGDHFLTLEGGQFVKKMKSDPGEIGDELKQVAESANAKLEDWMGWEIIIDDLIFYGKKIAKEAAKGHPLGDKPSAGLLKEAGKRNIRELVGACCDDPVLLARLNELLGYPAKGEFADHQTFCKEVVDELKNRDDDTDPPLKDMTDHIELTGKYKNDPDPDKWVENAKGQRRASADDTDILVQAMKDHVSMATRFAEAAYKGIEKHMAPVFESRRKAADELATKEKAVADLENQQGRAPPDPDLPAKLERAKAERDAAKTEHDMIDAYIQNKLISTLAGLKYVGGHDPDNVADGKVKSNIMQTKLLEAFWKSGASQDEINKVLGIVGMRSRSLTGRLTRPVRESEREDEEPEEREPEEEEPRPEGEPEDAGEEDGAGEDEAAPEDADGDGASIIPLHEHRTCRVPAWRPEIERTYVPVPVRKAA